MKTAVSFTGGKDSTLVCTLLQKIRDDTWFDQLSSSMKQRLMPYVEAEVTTLVTFVPANGTPFKAHSLQLIKLQADALGLPHQIMEVTAPYMESYKDNILKLKLEYGIEALATGDILDVCNG